MQAIKAITAMKIPRSTAVPVRVHFWSISEVIQLSLRRFCIDVET